METKRARSVRLAGYSGAMTSLGVQQRLENIHRDLDALAAEAARERDARLRSLQLAARSLRQAETTAQWVQILADSAAEFASRIAFFRVDGVTVQCDAVRGIDPVPGLIPFDEAPAFRQAVESRETVVSLIAESQLGAAAVGLRGRAHLFPLNGRSRVLGVMLVVDDGAPDVYGMEVLLSIGAATLETRAIAAAPLIAPAARPPEAQPSARRFARTAVAGWILELPALVAAGRARRNLYGELTQQIEQARTTFRERYLPGADYLHEEIVARLALGSVKLMGPSYPGPLGTGQ